MVVEETGEKTMVLTVSGFTVVITMNMVIMVVMVMHTFSKTRDEWRSLAEVHKRIALLHTNVQGLPVSAFPRLHLLLLQNQGRDNRWPHFGGLEQHRFARPRERRHGAVLLLDRRVAAGRTCLRHSKRRNIEGRVRRDIADFPVRLTTSELDLRVGPQLGEPLRAILADALLRDTRGQLEGQKLLALRLQRRTRSIEARVYRRSTVVPFRLAFFGDI